MNVGTERDAQRRCSAPDCVTVLSIYNSDHLCFAHADEVTRRRFEQRVAPERPTPPLYRPRIEPSRLVRAAGATT